MIPNRRYGWRPQLPDIRDLKRTLVRGVPALPVDLRPMFPPVYDQFNLGSCTANSVGGIMEYEMKRQGLYSYTPSRLFIYYNERADDGDVDQDNGSSIRESMKATNVYGAPPETMWQYDTAQYAVKPPDAVYTAAKLNMNLKYEAINQSLDGFREALQAQLAVAIGFSVYESFEDDSVTRTGIVSLPSSSESLQGGHAVSIVGDQPDQSRFIARNSWGPDWGDKGYFYFPYDYVLNPDLASDFWAIQFVGKAP